MSFRFINNSASNLTVLTISTTLSHTYSTNSPLSKHSLLSYLINSFIITVNNGMRSSHFYF